MYSLSANSEYTANTSNKQFYHVKCVHQFYMVHLIVTKNFKYEMNIQL